MKWILLVLVSSQSYAALPVVLPKAISFYKNQKSLFSSGQCSRADLEKTIIRSEMELSYQVTWDKRQFELKGKDLLREAQLLKSAQTAEALVLREQAQSNGRYLTSLKSKIPVEILATDDTWALIRHQNQEGWVPLLSLEATPEDQGAALTLIDTYLREKPEAGSRLVTTIPQGTRLQEFTIEKDWIHVRSQKYNGFVDLGHVYLRADFARWGHHKKLGWIQLQHRESFKLKTQDGLLFPLNEFNGFVSQPGRAFVLNSQIQGPQKRSRVEITKMLADRWAVSRLKEHGEVWWKRESLSLASQDPSSANEKIKTEALLKREIFSMAFTDSQKVQGIVSAKGIYRTEDGETWQRLESFGNNDYPVAVHKDGVWFVGSYRSMDYGKTFEPFIRWDKVADALAQKNISVGSMVKILKIESLKTPYIEILMDTGSHRVSLQTHILAQTWRMVK